MRDRVHWIAATGSAIGFAALLFIVQSGLTRDLDTWGIHHIQSIDGPAIGQLMWAVSVPGFTPTNWLMVASVTGGLWYASRRRESVFALLAAAAWLLVVAIKTLVDRPRPDQSVFRVVAEMTESSFPSGHTVFYVTFFGFAIHLALSSSWPAGARWPIVCILTGLIALIGPSRVWLGHHWPSDVLASYALGTAYLMVLLVLYRRQCYSGRSSDVTTPSHHH